MHAGAMNTVLAKRLLRPANHTLQKFMHSSARCTAQSQPNDADSQLRCLP